VPESHWQESGGAYTLSWGGRSWVLEVDKTGPGLRYENARGRGTLLSIYGLAAPGRFEDTVFTAATLVGVERYRSRIQATFAPADWGGLTVRAAWSPSCGGTGVDLEVQASASSVGLLHDVEVIVQSRWQRSDMPAMAVTERRVLARDARAAVLSYDGRETAGDLRSLATLPMMDSPRFHTVPSRGQEDELSYVEMVSPDDVARFMWLASIESRSPAAETLAFTYGLFGHDFEKGVVFRARLRGCWVNAMMRTRDPGELYRQFLAEPPPLGP
jgi:hypothetical protein